MLQNGPRSAGERSLGVLTVRDLGRPGDEAGLEADWEHVRPCRFRGEDSRG